MADLKEKEIATTGLHPRELDDEERRADSKWRGKFHNLLHGRNNNLNDLGKNMLEKSLEYDEAQLERDALKVRRKLDWLVLPMMCCTYMLSFLDKQTLNYSNAYGLQEDTHMTGDDYSWVASSAYFGWLIAAYPWNLALQRYPIGRIIGFMLFVWGTLCMLQATIFNFSGFFAIRFFMGMAEACISPAFVLLTSLLWTREEQSFRSSIWLSTNGFTSIIGALLSYGTGHAHNLIIPNWKLIYLVVGALTFIWGFVIIMYLPDGPHNAKMLNEYERIVGVWRVAKNQIGLKERKIRLYQVTEALLDGRSWLLWGTGACVGMLNGAVANFMSSIIKGFGFDPLQTTLLQTPGGAFEFFGCWFFGWLSAYPNMVGPSIIISSLPGMAGLIGILTISIEHRYALLGMAWMQNVLGAPLVLSWTVPGLNIAGHTKRSFVIGVYFALFCAGDIASPHLFLPSEAPRYRTAIIGLLGTYAALIVLQVVYTGWCWIENKRRDKLGLHGEMEEELLEGFDDLTDKQNKHFRYQI
ncbi:MFS transporter [Rhizodiscina lignyota]|uniref:MFS transporter n=1 Tax=Rhizodiscina lignyota TaxID=1504668 RepID=A0A9P4MC60_9PEZI|nr:MFS transporter [Rhizodiscina lignyota]